MPTQIDIVPEHELSEAQKAFIHLWGREYFGQVAVTNDLASASVHWRIFLRQDDALVSHVGITQYLIAIDGHPEYAGAVGGLFTARPEMRNGHGNALLDAAEAFIFDQLAYGSGILFCLPDLVPFYARRGWVAVQTPVTLEQRHGITTWPESVMTLNRGSTPPANRMIHIPIQPALRVPAPDGRPGAAIASLSKTTPRPLNPVNPVNFVNSV